MSTRSSCYPPRGPGRALPFLARHRLLAIQLALLEVVRKSELSSDRAAARVPGPDRVAAREPQVRGGRRHVADDLNAFLRAGQRSTRTRGAIDRIFKILGVLAGASVSTRCEPATAAPGSKEGNYDRVLRGGIHPPRAGGSSTIDQESTRPRPLHEGSEGRRERRGDTAKRAPGVHDAFN